MKVKLWGARGAIAIPGPKTRTYGVNTPCVAVDIQGEAPIVLDGGLGLHWLGDTLGKGIFGHGKGRAHLLLSHTHWGHIQGLPFCTPMLIPGNRFDIYGRGDNQQSILDLLLTQMQSTYCPVPNFLNAEIGADVAIHELDADQLTLGTTQIDVADMGTAHGGPCLGYRLTNGRVVLVYLPAVEYLDDARRQRAVDLARGADLLIHDAFYNDEEYEQFRGAGHSSPSHAVETALRANASRLVLFNHHPERSDAELDAMLQRAQKAADQTLTIEAAHQGDLFDLTI